MRLNNNLHMIKLILLLALTMVATGCSHNDDNNTMAMYEVTVTNITNNQPLAPVAVIAHNSGYQPWHSGSAASDGLEMLAEGGDPSQLVAEADMDTGVVATATSTGGPFVPGTAKTITIETMPDTDLQLSIATMLVNTNDAFAGVNSLSIGDMAMGDTTSMMAKVYDAGTEDNTESAATIPGPAGMGEGFNAARDDVNFVSIHAGVVTIDDGLATSALDESHRWLGPAAEVSVTRVQ
ncbi:MAG: spondin domain-containing protein [Gammaproteobacteria bacterium]|jgi:hypothetical protein